MTGGGYGSTGRISSTEIIVRGSDAWETISSLPIRAWGLSAVNYENSILTFGK